MIAIAGGLGAALSWATATLCSSRSSRIIGPSSVLAWVMVFGLIVSLPPALAVLPAASHIDAGGWAGMALNGVSYTAGLLLAYRALVIGRVSIVTPIVSTEGGIAAIGSVVLGEPLGIPSALILAAIAVGVVLASIDRRGDETAEAAAAATLRGREGADFTRRSVILAIGSALAFSVGLISSAHLGDGVPISWIVLTSRATGALFIGLPLLVGGGLRLTRRALPLVVVSGVLEAAGSAAYVAGAHASAATAAVLGSQFAAIAAVVAYFLFGERLARIQVVGVVLIVIGVASLAYVRA